jgi:hypothetical protein
MGSCYAHRADGELAPMYRLVLLAGLVGACAEDPAGRPASWSYVHAAILAPSCATSSCHGERTAAAGVALDDPDTAYEALLGKSFVTPGDPASPLLLLLEGDEVRRMPPDAPLPQADIDLVRTWVEAGAMR